MRKTLIILILVVGVGLLACSSAQSSGELPTQTRDLGATIQVAVQTAMAEQSPPTITVVPTARPALARPTPQPNGTGCSIGGRPVSCEVFRDHTINESIDDFTGLDCEAMANIAVLRMEGWALAESMGRVSHKEAQSAGYAISYAVDYLGCGNNRAWQAYLFGSP